MKKVRECIGFIHYSKMNKPTPKKKFEVIRFTVFGFVISLFLIVASSSFAVADVRNSETVESKTYVQQKSVAGIVVDENGEPLPGVTIVVKGTTNGTVTGEDGSFNIEDVSIETVLQFSFVGMTTKEITVGSQSTINVTLLADAVGLEEVVAIGYGTQKKSDLTGAVSSVKAEEMQKMSVRRLEEAIQGRASGVMISKGKGTPGSSATIHVRGVGSIGNTGPLWVVDGVRMDPGNHLNMNDVESIEILKDAAASAIYGARAAHGVILVTTKRGSSSAPQVNIKAQVGVHTALNLPDMLNTEQFLEMNVEARKNGGADYSDFDVSPSGLPDTDWIDEVWRNGLEQNYNLSVSGGSDKAKYFFSAAYDKEDGVMIDNWFKKYSIRANSDFKIGKRIKIGESLSISRTGDNPTFAPGSDMETIYRAIPTMALYDETNPYGGWGRGPTYFPGRNPVGAELQSHELEIVNWLVGNIYVQIDLMEGLYIKGTVGGEISALRNSRFNEAFDYGNFKNTIADLTYTSQDSDNLLGNVIINYEKTFGAHSIQAMAGYEARKTNSWIFGSKVQEFPVTYTESQALATGSQVAIERSNIGYSRLLSQFGRLTYNYDNKYLFQANVRRDGSSNFGSSNRWGVFPSASFGWRVSQEKFMENISFLSNFKVRASWGINGSDNIDSYLYASTYTNKNSMYVFDTTGEAGRTRGFFLRRFSNAEAKWEEIEQTDIGFDLGILNNKFSFTADYYVKNTRDMLFPVALPLSFGVSTTRSGSPESTKINLGTLENKGFEFSATYNEKFGGLNLSVTGNGSFNSNEIKSLNRPDDVISAGYEGVAIKQYLSRTEVGQPMGYFYGYVVDGVFQNQSEVDAANAGASDGVYWRSGTAPGDFKFKDIASYDEDGNVVMTPDGKVTDADKTQIGNPWPKFIYGLNINLDYKSFDLNLFFQGVQGVDLFNANKAYLNNVFQDYNPSTEVYSRWTGEGSTNVNPRLNYNDPNGNFTTPSTYYVEDGSYLKLRNVQLGYTFPKSLVSKIGLGSTRIFVSGQNMLTFTKYSGLDPELSGSNTQRGIDGYSSYPHHRLVSVGVEVSF